MLKSLFHSWFGEKRGGHDNGTQGALAGMQVPKLCIMWRRTIFNQFFSLGPILRCDDCHTQYQNGFLWPPAFDLKAFMPKNMIRVKMLCSAHFCIVAFSLNRGEFLNQ